MLTAKYMGITFTDDDVVNVDDFCWNGYNPHNVRPWLLHDHGFVVAVVFASNLQDALDEAVDANKLDRYLIDLTDENVRKDYLIENKVTPGYDEACPEFVDADGRKYWWREGYEPAFLGNASEPFDIEGLDYIELPNPKFSFVALFNAAQKGGKQ